MKLTKKSLTAAAALAAAATAAFVVFVLLQPSEQADRKSWSADGGKELANSTLILDRELSGAMKEELQESDMETFSYSAPASAVGKLPPNGNPLLAHKFGADPYALVFDGRVYVYNTHDVFEYDSDGQIKDNSYGTINRLSIISSDDLVNWTDHGNVQAAGRQGAAKWASQSWAPAAAHKVIDGRDQFFLYFANNASGIGVLTSDSPTGPWSDPIGKPLISRTAPGVQEVTWLFDPAVLVDDDGKAYIYFGGGVPEGKSDRPDTARVMELGDDMISVVGEAVTIPAPYMFENAGINKVNGMYYFTYCTNFIGGVRPSGSPAPGVIAYMVSDHPMGPWTYKGTILKNPGHFFGVGGNNHHAIFEFSGQWYITYHAQTLSKAMGVPKGYRSTHLNKVEFAENGDILEIVADLKGVDAVKAFDPFTRVEAETMAWSAGIEVEAFEVAGQSGLAVSGIHNGDWIAVAGADFGEGAVSATAWVSDIATGGVIELRLGSPEGQLAGVINVPAGGDSGIAEFTTQVSGVSGKHDLYLVFRGTGEDSLFALDAWRFDRS